MLRLSLLLSIAWLCLVPAAAAAQAEPEPEEQQTIVQGPLFSIPLPGDWKPAESKEANVQIWRSGDGEQLTVSYYPFNEQTVTPEQKLELARSLTTTRRRVQQQSSPSMQISKLFSKVDPYAARYTAYETEDRHASATVIVGLEKMVLVFFLEALDRDESYLEEARQVLAGLRIR